MLDTVFKLRDHGTTVRTEILAGITTFLTIVYIVFVNPSILQAAGMDQGAVFVATCLAAALGTAIMGLYANYPIALAPGMGLNAYFTYGVVLGMGHSWQVALGAVFLSGILFVILSLLPVREWIVNSIPRSLKMAISAGIGLFLAIIGLKNAGIVLPRLRQALLADSVATVGGAAMGTSTTTSYIESAAGINAGGRTGLTAVTVAILFALCLFLSPLASTIPAYATAPALLFVACLMVRGLAEINWDDVTEVAPAVVTAVSMPLTFSIATGIGLGFISYAAIKILAGRGSEAGVAVMVLSVAFIAKFAII